MDTVLIYVGDGSFLDGIPARDLSNKDIIERGLDVEDLAASELYRLAGDLEDIQKACTPDRGVIDLRDGVDDQEASLAGRTLSNRRQED